MRSRRVAETLRRLERSIEELFGTIDVGGDVDGDVAEEPQRERERPVVAVRAAQLDRTLEHLGAPGYSPSQ